MKRAAVLLLLAAVTACGHGHRPASSAAPEPRTSGSKPDAPVPPATPATPPAGVSNQRGELGGQPDPLVSTVQPELPDLAARYRVERGAPAGRSWLVIRNTYLTVQYVFLGGELLGFVPPDTEGRFDIPPGAHSVTISDSRDGQNNSKSLSEVFDAGYAYHYDVVAR